MWDKIYINAVLATMDGNAPYGLIERGALAIEQGKISFIGTMDSLTGAADSLAHEVIDLSGRLITPGLIDCHTHLIFGGDRSGEFEARLLGKSYEEIAKAGGGIISTVRATREASEAELVALALPRLDAFIAEGVTTIEIKSGYGLTVKDEIKMLRAARQLEHERPIRVRKTLLAAHAVPPEFKGNADGYIDLVCNEIMPAAHAEGLVDAVDGFCEGIGFSTQQIERVFETAKTLGLPIKLHAEQLSDLGGARLAAKYGGLSADHLEYLSPQDTQILANAGTVAVLLPGAFYYLRETKLPPIKALRDAGAHMAIATDCNPGTSPMTSVLLAMNMCCTLFQLTPEEALAGTTCHAARALGLDDCGMLKSGFRADLAIWDIHHPASLAYTIGHNSLKVRAFSGSD
ncbi:imidazolonepropionase [Hyphococcus lacteus]|uniref:Imidazolonepropionase n=1 Tax=Hyphococcus lacteus TaxID=3143536 RepID=A0ABV3Z6H9_9PROT